MLVHQSLDCFVVVVIWRLYVAVRIMGLSDIGFCVFSLGSIRICVGLMFWIRVEFVGVWLFGGLAPWGVLDQLT